LIGVSDTYSILVPKAVTTLAANATLRPLNGRPLTLPSSARH
jgi:hypothetical protein